MEAVRKIRIVVADDSEIYRNNVCMMLRLQDDMDVVAEAENGYMAIQVVQTYKPDILLIDIKMPRIDGIEATRAISARFPSLKIIGMSAYEDCGFGEQIKQSGAWGYIDKCGVLRELLSTIREAFSAGRMQ